MKGTEISLAVAAVVTIVNTASLDSLIVECLLVYDPAALHCCYVGAIACSRFRSTILPSHYTIAAHRVATANDRNDRL